MTLIVLLSFTVQRLEQAIQCSVSLPRKRSLGFVTCFQAVTRDEPFRTSVCEAKARWERTSPEERRIWKAKLFERGTKCREKKHVIS